MKLRGLAGLPTPLIAATLFFGVGVMAKDDSVVDEKSLPAAVQRILAAQFPKAQVLEFKEKKQGDKSRFEMKLKDEWNPKESYGVLVDQDGLVLKEDRHVIPENRVPPNVRVARLKWTALKSDATWQVRREEKEGARYLVELTVTSEAGKRKSYKAQFKEDGQLIKGDKVPHPQTEAPQDPEPAPEKKPDDLPVAPQASKDAPVQEARKGEGNTQDSAKNDMKEEEKEKENEKEGEIDPDILLKVSKLIRGTLKEDEEDRKKAWTEISDMGNLAVPGLIGVYRQESTTPQMVRSILIALEDSNDRRAGPALVELLRNKDPMIRRDAARAIGASNYQAGVGPLGELYRGKKEDEEVRLHAASAAAKLKDAEATKALQVLLSSKSSDVRARAVYALGKFGTRSDLEALGQALADPDKGVREEAVESIRRVGGESAPRYLVRATSDTDYKIRNAAVGALKQITKKDFEKPDQWQAWWAQQATKKENENDSKE